MPDSASTLSLSLYLLSLSLALYLSVYLTLSSISLRFCLCLSLPRSLPLALTLYLTHSVLIGNIADILVCLYLSIQLSTVLNVSRLFSLSIDVSLALFFALFVLSLSHSLYSLSLSLSGISHGRLLLAFTNNPSAFHKTLAHFCCLQGVPILIQGGRYHDQQALQVGQRGEGRPQNLRHHLWELSVLFMPKFRMAPHPPN